MRRWFEALPIHRKLIALAFGVSAVALVLAVAGLSLFEVARFRAGAVEDARALAQLIAENTAAAIVFDDERAAAETLATVRVRPVINRACLYRMDGSLMAAYLRRPGDGCRIHPQERRTWRVVTAGADVVSNSRVVGRVFVDRTLADLRGRIIAGAIAALITLVAAGLIALALAQALQRIVSRPVVALAQAARGIGLRQSYEVPVIPAPPDETGELVRAFGEMVQRVGDANAALTRTNEALRREIAERRRMEDEREALLAREREASRLKDEFLAAVSHELRTPLNAILGWTQILTTTTPTEETRAKALASLSRNAHAQSRVIQDLLDISRIITGKLQLMLDAVDLRSVVESAIEVIDPVASSKGVVVSADVPTVSCVVRADYDRIRQVLWNLLSNAVKFTPSGGEVRVRLDAEGESYAITVSDNGIGIAPGFLPFVFDRFRQADGSTTREQGGLGLGLAIVKELVELHGGTVHAESAGIGQGAVFTLHLPRMARLPGRAQDDQPTHDGELPRLDGVSVVIVDDNVDARDIAASALTSAGAAVRAFEAGGAAVNEWRHAPADVLLCDLAMPGMDGFEVLERIRRIDAADGRHTPAIAVTAYASGVYRERCLAAGFQEHLVKPYLTADIVRGVAAVARG